MPQRNQGQVHFVNVRAGTALANRQIHGWMTKGQRALQSVAASGIARDIHSTPDWLHARTSLSPLRLPEGCGGEGCILPLYREVFLILAERSRAVIPRSRTEERSNTLPHISMTHEEI